MPLPIRDVDFDITELESSRGSPYVSGQDYKSFVTSSLLRAFALHFYSPFELSFMRNKPRRTVALFRKKLDKLSK